MLHRQRLEVQMRRLHQRDAFLIIAAVVYFLVVSPMSKLMARMTGKEEATLRECPECRGEIPVAARRCQSCTSEVGPVRRCRLVALIGYPWISDCW